MTLPSENAILAGKKAMLHCVASADYRIVRVTPSILEAAYAVDVQPLLARVAELEAFQITAEMNIGLNYCKTHRTIVLPFVEEFPCCVAAERDRLKEENRIMHTTSLTKEKKIQRLEAELERIKAENRSLSEENKRR